MTGVEGGYCGNVLVSVTSIDRETVLWVTQSTRTIAKWLQCVCVCACSIHVNCIDENRCKMSLFRFDGITRRNAIETTTTTTTTRKTEYIGHERRRRLQREDVCCVVLCLARWFGCVFMFRERERERETCTPERREDEEYGEERERFCRELARTE